MLQDGIAKSTATLSMMSKKLRRICVKSLEKHRKKKKQKVGGVNVIVHIDESKFCHKRKKKVSFSVKLSVSQSGPTVKPSVSLLPPSSLQLSEESASLLCLLSAYSPQGALVSWTVDGSVVKDGVVTSAEEQKKDGYTRSSTLTLSKALWEQGEEFV
ncbi:hypothetical protein QTP70_000929 [Hemibagrus guttatus]|uniref:Ig-like domain-containing protein n=1 Tax=Hemibagrus guttatus TaxID=175788 RepID=A0AAE0QMJ2_9TELE|nr:hypothetical protein QTP70_000929 [Hemibagrus guttatus]